MEKDPICQHKKRKLYCKDCTGKTMLMLECECGSSVRIYSMPTHLQSKKHSLFISGQDK